MENKIKSAKFNSNASMQDKSRKKHPHNGADDNIKYNKISMGHF